MKMVTPEIRNEIERGLVLHFIRAAKLAGWSAVNVDNHLDNVSAICITDDDVMSAVFGKYVYTCIVFAKDTRFHFSVIQRGLSIDCILDKEVPVDFEPAMDSIADFVEILVRTDSLYA